MKKIVYLLLVSVALTTGCSEFQKALKSKDYSLKYKLALKYYDKGDWFRSQSLINDILPVYRGTSKANKLYYMNAYAYYHQNEFIMAAYHFKTFIKTYPNDTLVPECEFMLAECFYKESPRYDLDQQNTLKAIEGYQLFINKYPLNERIETANNRIENLRGRLEKKSLENAKLYYKLGEYKGALIALKNSLKDFPDTPHREELLYLIMKSNFELANKSIKSLQKERYQETINQYYAFADEFPKSKKIKEAQKIYDKCVSGIKK